MDILFCNTDLSMMKNAKDIFLRTDSNFLYVNTIRQLKFIIKTTKFDIIVVKCEKIKEAVIKYIKSLVSYIMPLIYTIAEIII